jgi:hypothetical protein
MLLPIVKPLADARGSDQSRDREGAVAQKGDRHFLPPYFFTATV